MRGGVLCGGCRCRRRAARPGRGRWWSRRHVPSGGPSGGAHGSARRADGTAGGARGPARAAAADADATPADDAAAADALPSAGDGATAVIPAARHGWRQHVAAVAAERLGPAHAADASRPFRPATRARHDAAGWCRGHGRHDPTGTAAGWYWWTESPGRQPWWRCRESPGWRICQSTGAVAASRATRRRRRQRQPAAAWPRQSPHDAPRSARWRRDDAARRRQSAQPRREHEALPAARARRESPVTDRSEWRRFGRRQSTRYWR